MNKTRLPVAIMTVALFSTAILALLTFYRTTGAVRSNSLSSGMGELQLIEAPGSNHPYLGMGELRRYEAPVPRIGMGDLRRIEAEQVLAATYASNSQVPDRVCPNLSTSYGERDTGASAPVYILLAKGC
jgi:hypothetical protein